MEHIIFTSRLFLETKEFHKLIDNHSFTNNIKNSKNTGNIYINFNKICIEAIQKNDDIFNQDFKQIYKKLYRQTSTENFDDIYISYELNLLIERCKKYPLEHSYLFYLGLISGGNI